MSHILRIAGLTLEVTCDADAGQFMHAFDRVIVAGGVGLPRAVDARLSLSADPQRFEREPYSGLAHGRYRFSDGAFALHAHTPTQLQVYRPGVRAESRGGVAGAEAGFGVQGPELKMLLSAEALAAGDLLAHPAWAALTAWLGAQGCFAVHAAGIELHGCGLLLVGEGGKGKTTTALAAVQRGFSYLGDDLCFIDLHGDAAVIHGVYSTCKVNPDTEQRLGLSQWAHLGRTPKQKSVLRLPPEVEFSTQAPLRAVVLVSEQQPATESPVILSASVAIRVLSQAFAPALRSCGPTADWLQTMTALARRVPVVRIGRSWDLDAVAEHLTRLVKG